MAVKLFVTVALFVWLLCGVAGAWMIEGRQDLHLRTIALGPISLIKGFNEDPLTYVA